MRVTTYGEFSQKWSMERGGGSYHIGNNIDFVSVVYHLIPYGLVVRIPGFHPGGPGSIPGVGTVWKLFFLVYNST